MQAIKALVIGLGILIVAGIALLAYAFYARMNDPEFKLMRTERQQASSARAAQRAEGFGEAASRYTGSRAKAEVGAGVRVRPLTRRTSSFAFHSTLVLNNGRM